ncbi:hypothetical protein [Corynebacterium belfantii]|uniref:hypothetical protein n=1 Tax=Corynebacterium belfantii TaxID=2014537 RepID=UPI00248BB95D|nr:hypothetical protein [Corynebacterium belfantii]
MSTWIAHDESSDSSVATSQRFFKACVVAKPAVRRWSTSRGGGVSARAVNASEEALIMMQAEPEHNGEAAVLRQLP